MKLRLLVAACVLVASACRERDSVSPRETAAVAAPPENGTAFLAVSSMTPLIGDTIVVSAALNMSDSTAVASYRVRLLYDSEHLTYVDDVTPTGMLRVVNPQSGEVVVAAAGEGLIDGNLFALRFRVSSPDAIRSLKLAVDELNDANFGSRLSSVRSSDALRLARPPAIPRAARPH
jgi:hypothetical protein